MISIRDSKPLAGRSTVTVTLLVINLLLWVWQVLLQKDGFEIASDYGLISWRFMNALQLPQWQGGVLENAIVPMFTSMFMHRSWRHFISNGCFLWVFGENVEKYCGHLVFFGFYLVCGLGASLVHVILDPNCMSPIIGASGAIAGIASANLLIFPRARVRIRVANWSLQIPTLVFILLFFLGGAVTNTALFHLIGEAKPAPIGHLLHAGGFASGILLVVIARMLRILWRKPRTRDSSATPFSFDGEGKQPDS
jgi:membrane associated rhomboid family serine protease